MRFEPQDIIIIAFVAFLIFGGAARLPETMRAVGKAIREFRGALASDDPAPTPAPKEITAPANDSTKPA